MAGTIVVLGVGALGSYTVQFLRSLDAKLKVVDFDRIERKNVMSQFHGKSNVGKNKAKALALTMQYLFGTKLEAVPHKLTSDNLKQLLGDADLVVECFDNGESRRLVQNYVRAGGIPCIHGAVDAEGSFGRVVWDAKFVIDDEDVVGAPTCEDGENLPFIGVVSSLIARSVQRFLKTGIEAGYEITPIDVIPT